MVETEQSRIQSIHPKIYIADFGNFKQGFLIMKLIQNSNFRVQGILFSTIVLITRAGV